MGSEKIIVPDDHINGDAFVVDLNNFSNGGIRDSISNATTSINSRINLQRSLSRKVAQRGTDRDVINNVNSPAPSSSPTAVEAVNLLEKPGFHTTLQMGLPDHPKANEFQHQHHHQITIKTSGVSNITADGRWSNNRSSFKRSPPSWFSDPKRILLFFATLSCTGTILLIFFTLSMKNHIEKDNVLDWN